jgi:hypothetical protein
MIRTQATIKKSFENKIEWKKKEIEIIEGRKKRGNEQKGRLNFFLKKKKITVHTMVSIEGKISSI